MTQRQMIENFPKVSQENDLLWLYLYDTQLGRKPDAVETEKAEDGRVLVQLWRANSASGGYVVICQVETGGANGNANLLLLDKANDNFRSCYDNYTLPTRLCLERLTIARNRRSES